MKKLLLLLLLLASGVQADLNNIGSGDLPYTHTRSGDAWDTIMISSNITTTGSGITITGASMDSILICSDVTGTRRRLTFGTGEGDDVHGIQITGASGGSDWLDNIIIRDLEIIQDTDDDSAYNAEAIGLTFKLRNIRIANCSTYVEGHATGAAGTAAIRITGSSGTYWNCNTWDGDDCTDSTQVTDAGEIQANNYDYMTGQWAYNIDIDTTAMINNTDEYDNRQLFQASALQFNNCMNENFDNDTSLYNVKLDNCVLYAPHAALRMAHRIRNGGGLHFVRGLIYNSEITVDARNDRYSCPSGNLNFSHDNAYGIVAGQWGYNSIIRNTKIYAGENYAGGRGILCEGVGRRYPGQPENNHLPSLTIIQDSVWTHEGRSDYYCDTIDNWGFRARFGNKGIVIDSSYFHSTGDSETTNSTTAYGWGCGVVYYTAYSAEEFRHFRLSNTTIIAEADDDLYLDATALKINGYDNTSYQEDTSIHIYGNTIRSSEIAVEIGNENANFYVPGFLFKNNHIEFADPSFSPSTFSVGQQRFLNGIFRDNTFGGVGADSATFDDMTLTSGSQPISILTQKTLITKVIDTLAQPIENASVIIDNGLTTPVEVDSGLTDANGIYESIVNILYDSLSTGGDTSNADYNDYYIEAIAGDSSNDSSITVLPNTDTLVIIVGGESVVIDPPVAAFSGTPTSGNASLEVTFTDASTNTPTSWAWDFGDEATSTSQNPTHTYTTAGTYTVTLTATNAGGSDDEIKTDYITVTDPPEATVIRGKYGKVHNKKGKI